MTTAELAIIIIGSALLALCARHVGRWLASAWARAGQDSNKGTDSETAAEPGDEAPAYEAADQPGPSAANAQISELLSRAPGFGKVEPRSVQRTASLELYGIYTAFTEAGFTTDQAMDLTRTVLSGAAGNGGK